MNAVLQAFDIPQIGLGTCSPKGDIGFPAMAEALACGYRHIDSAQGYGNEASVGRAIEESGLDRGDIFVTTKISRQNLSRDRLAPSLRESLEKLRSDYVDSTLIHWPGGPGDPPIEEYMEALAAAWQDGLTRHIGLSNFPIALVDRAIAVVGEGVIRNDQFEVHPFLQNRKLRDHCERCGIRVTAYMPIAGGRVLDDPVIQAIAERHGATPAQISIAWILSEGMVAIPSSSNPERMRENLAAGEVRLEDQDKESIRQLDRGLRIINPKAGPDWD